MLSNYQTEGDFTSKVEEITLLDELSYNEADKAPYYIDSNNVLYYLATNSLNEEDYVKVFKVPANCEIEVIDNFSTNYYDITSN